MVYKVNVTRSGEDNDIVEIKKDDFYINQKIREPIKLHEHYAPGKLP